MAEKPPFKRSLTPRVGGVTIPPKREDEPSSMEMWLRSIKESQDSQHEEVMREVRETRRDVDALERRVSLVERGVLRIETLDAKFDALNERLWQNQQRDLVTKDELVQRDVATKNELFQIKLRMVEEAKKTAETAGDVSGEDAGRKAAKTLTRKYGVWGALAVLVIAYAKDWLPIVWKALNQ